MESFRKEMIEHILFYFMKPLYPGAKNSKKNSQNKNNWKEIYRATFFMIIDSKILIQTFANRIDFLKKF